MKVSIIVDNYNYAQWVGEAIESALNQSYRNIEVLAVDDGSKDNSAEVLEQYRGRVQVLLKENGGQASAFNLAFPRTTGDLVMFLDADDVLLPHAAETVVRLWRPEMSKFHFRLSVVDEHLRPTGVATPRVSLPEGRLERALLQRGMYVSSPTSGNAFSRAAMECVMPIPDEKSWVEGAEGYLVNLMPFFGTVGKCDEELCLYRIHAGSGANLAGFGGVDTRNLEKLSRFDLRQRALLERFAGQHGLDLSPGAVWSHWLHLKLRLASRKLMPEKHLYPGDTLLGVAARLLRAVWSAGELRLPARCLFSIWAAAVALLPQRWARPLVAFAFASAQRPPLLNRMV